MTPAFYPDFYRVPTLTEAKRACIGDVIFKEGGGLTHEERWEPELASTMEFIAGHIGIAKWSRVIDYGCGMGRVAKELIDRYGCEVVGVDSSESMRRFATEYVDSDRFSAVAEADGEFDVALCLWVLEHCEDPARDIAVIDRLLKPRAPLLVFDNYTRNVPTVDGFADDKVDVTHKLRDHFGTRSHLGRFDAGVLHPQMALGHWWAICVKSMKLNLGCAFNHMEDAENVDINPLCKPDRIVDLEKFPWPWEDESVDEICMYHSLEHLGGNPEVFLVIMRELYRVLVPGGEVHIQVPHPRHDNYINSPTHVRPITGITLQQFSQEWNRKTRSEGYANETFGEHLGVDFKITQNHLVIAQPWWKKYQAGLITKEELEFACSSYWNVIEECRLTIEKVPLNRQSPGCKEPAQR